MIIMATHEHALTVVLPLPWHLKQPGPPLTTLVVRAFVYSSGVLSGSEYPYPNGKMLMITTLSFENKICEW